MSRKKLMISIMYVGFSLATLMTGTLAWFSSNQSVTTTGMAVNVITPEEDELISVSLYKFDYPEASFGRDYLNPSGGSVHKYDLDAETGQFGMYEDGVFVPYVMNTYDPLDMMISSSSLFDVNTNVVYEIKVRPSGASVTSANVNSILGALTIDDAETQILASEVLNFDIYSDHDFEDSDLNTPTASGKKYYPSYVNGKEEKENNPNYEIFYKCGYLSCNKADNEHGYFYATNTEVAKSSFSLLIDDNITLDAEGIATIYININYSVNQLTKYQYLVNTHTYDVLTNYSFSLSFN